MQHQNTDALDSLCADLDEHHTWRLKVAAALGISPTEPAEYAVAMITARIIPDSAPSPSQLALDGCDCSGARADIDGND